jgi:ABC-type glycerol-3-phosphate transport system substrate-binding protein
VRNSAVKGIFSAAAALALTVGLVGCSTAGDEPTDKTSEAQPEAEVKASEALESYADAERAQADAYLKSNTDMYKDIEVVTTPPASVEFVYTYATQLDGEEVAGRFEEMSGDLQRATDTELIPAMQGYGVEGDPSVIFTYVNADGSEIWSKEFSSSEK